MCRPQISCVYDSFNQILIIKFFQMSVTQYNYLFIILVITLMKQHNVKIVVRVVDGIVSFLRKRNSF